jgi:hypothetical protein
LLYDLQIAFETKTIDRFYIPSKNSTIVFKKMDSVFEIKENNQIWVWEDLWNAKKEIVKFKILSFFGQIKSLPARVCVVSRINKKMAEEFLNENHLQGYVSSKIKYGLFLKTNYQRLIETNVPAEGLLVSVMTFSGKRMFRDNSKSYEMTRFGGLKKMRIVGGFSKLINAFLKDTNADHIMTYIDKDWSNGDNLEKLGFEKTDILKPLFFELNENKERVKANAGEKYFVYNAGSVKMEWKKQ